MQDQKTIAIIGATGNQGSSVARIFLESSNWHVRCLTRNINSAASQHLSSLGAEVISADLNDVSMLVKAFEGCHAIFLLTDFWGPYTAGVKEGRGREEMSRVGMDIELQHVKNAATAAKTTISTLERLVFSALGPMERASGGKYSHSYHWESKARAVEYLERDNPELASKTSYIYPGCYSTNPFLLPRKNAETGEYEMTLPCAESTIFPIIDPQESTGSFVRALIDDEPPMTKLLAYDSCMTAKEALDAWCQATGKNARYVTSTVEEMHRATGLPLEVLEAPAFMGEFGFTKEVEGIIEPKDLRRTVDTASYYAFLGKQSDEFLLTSQNPQV